MIESSPSAWRWMNSEAWARSSASRISASLASGRPTWRFSRIERANSIGSWNTTPMLRRSEARQMSRMSVAVDPDRARLRIEGSVEETQRRRLAGAGRADKRDVLPRLDREGHVRDGGALAVIGEGHVLELDRAREALDVLGRRAVVPGRSGVEDLVEFPHLRRLQEELIDEGHDLFEPADQHGGDRHEHDDVADGRPAGQVEPGAEQEDGGDRQGCRSASRDRGERPPGQDGRLGGQELADRGPEFADLRLGAREGLDDGHVAECVRGLFGEPRMVALDRALQGLGLAQHEGGQDREQGSPARRAGTRGASSGTASRGAARRATRWPRSDRGRSRARARPSRSSLPASP